VKIIPPKYADVINELLLKDPNVPGPIAVKHLRKKFCGHGIEPSDWPGAQRLNQKLRNMKKIMKQTRKQQVPMPIKASPVAQVCFVPPPSPGTWTPVTAADKPSLRKRGPTEEEKTFVIELFSSSEEGSDKNFAPEEDPEWQSHEKPIAEKYCAMIDQLLDSKKDATPKELLSSMKKIYIRTGGPNPPNWPGDARIKTQIRMARRKKFPPTRMISKYKDSIDEILLADVSAKYADVHSELFRRFKNEDNSHPEDWPGKSKIMDRIHNTRRRIRRSQRRLSV